MTLPPESMSEKPALIKCSHEEYDDIEALRSTGFKTFIESPQKYCDMCKTKQQRKKPTRPMDLGSILHHFVLDGVKDYEVWTEKKVGNEWKAFKADCDSRGVTILQKYGKTDEVHHLEMQIQAVTRNKAAVELFEKTAVREQSIVWNNHGVKSKARLDMWTESGPIADLKTSRDPDPRKFFNQMVDLGYHISAVWYEMARDAVWQNTYEHPFYWIVVSNSPWYHCRVFEMDTPVREAAQRRIKEKLVHFRHCQKHNDWTDHTLNKSEVLFATEWFLRQNDDPYLVTK